jgi:hypothetical protein
MDMKLTDAVKCNTLITEWSDVFCLILCIKLDKKSTMPFSVLYLGLWMGMGLKINKWFH